MKMTIPDLPNTQSTTSKGTASSTAVKPPAPPAPSSPKTVANMPIANSYVGADGSTNYANGYGGGVGGGADMSEVDYLAGDSSYQAQLSALMKALEDYRADTTAQRSRYDVDYGKGLKSLGWNDLDGDFATPDGEWDFNDQNTAAGRGFTSQRNDFASRGMLQSSDYARSNDLLMRNLNDQRSSMETGRNRFTQDLASQLSAFETENEAARQMAKQEALMRMAAPYFQL